MGVIQRQSARSTALSFLGYGFGTITRLIMPVVLLPAQIGILSLLDVFSGYFVVIFNMGYNLILKRIFPAYRSDENGHSGFLIFGILLTLVGVAIGVGVYYLLENWLISGEGENGELFRPFAYLVPVLILFRTLFLNMDGYVRMLFKTVIGIFLDSVLAKVVLLIGIILFAVSAINFEHFVYIYCVVLSLPGIIIVAYGFMKTDKIVWPKREILRNSAKLRSYVLFGMLSGASYSIVQYTDLFMINKLSPVDAISLVGIYSIIFFAANLITVPAKSLNRISAVIIAESWQTNDLKNIQDVYQKSASNLMVIGGYLFIVGWACIDPVLHFLPEYEIGKYAFFFLGFAKLIELGTGVNMEIIESSNLYRYNTYFNICLAVLVIVLNYFFIIHYSIVGAAISSFLAMTIVNILRAVLLKVKYNLWPFQRQHLKIALIITGFILLTTALHQLDYNPVLQLALNAVAVTLIYWIIMISLGLAPEIKEWIDKMRNTFLKRK